MNHGICTTIIAVCKFGAFCLWRSLESKGGVRYDVWGREAGTRDGEMGRDRETFPEAASV